MVRGNAREVMRQAEAAIATSGTATLETALIGTPHILVYKTSAFTYWFARSVVKIKHIGLVNIISGKTVCPELIQEAASPEAMVQKTAVLLKDSPEKSDMLLGYENLRSVLGNTGAAENVARLLEI